VPAEGPFSVRIALPGTVPGKKRYMKKRILALFILLFVFFIPVLKAQRIPSQKPKLIVGITVSGMRYDYLTVYWDRFGDEGFRKMAGTGTICRNARYGNLVTESAVGYATIATGANPESHGIAADYWYERLKKQVKYCVSDENVSTVGGSFEAGKYAPSSLMMRTLSDELRVVSRFQSKVIGVSMDPKAAILLSGHTANEVYWIDPLKLSWTTSSFYLDSLPDWVDRFNKKDFPSVYLQSEWKPLLPLSEYSESMLDNNPYEKGFSGQITFPYEMKRLADKQKPSDKFNILMATPYGNTLTKDFAISAIVEEELGKHDVTDWINISFNAGRYLSERYSTWSMETEDLYLRLDKDLAHLLEFLDDYIGLENVLIYLTADQAVADDPAYLAETKIPSGYFNSNSSIYLLKAYLNAIYGQGDWVSFYYAQQIYLNQQLIEDSRLSLDEVQDRVARFMIQFEGVSNALPAFVLQRNDFNEGIFGRIQNSYNQKRSGDVLLYLTPGWVEKGTRTGTGYDEFRSGSHVPLIFYGWKINRISLPMPVSPADIVPTLAYLLEITAPEGTTGEVIPQIVK